MIDFLYPAFGLAALAAAIPLLLHLIRRREVRRVTFPAIRYLRQAEQRQARRLRLRHLLLLASRVLIILLLAAAAAGPLIGRGGPADHHPTAVAMIIDDSQSGTALIGEARIVDLYADRVRETLELANPADRLATFSAVRPESGATLRQPGALQDSPTLGPTAGMADLATAIKEAVAWLRSQDELELELHIFTDLQAVSLPGPPAAADEAQDAGAEITAFLYAPVELPEQNGAVVAVLPEALPLTAGRETSVSVELRWFGAEQPSAATVVRLVVGSEIVAAAEAAFGESALLSLPAQTAGWFQGYAEIDGYGLSADDRRYFSWQVRPAVRVATSGDPGSFVESALRTLELGRRLSRVADGTAEVVVSASGDGIEAALATGRSVIVLPPDDPLDLPRLNLRLERAQIPWRLSADAGRGTSRIQAGSVAGLEGVEVRRAFRFESSAGHDADTVLARLEDGSAWLIRGTTADGSVYLLFASPLTAQESDLPVSAAMVPALDAIIGDWARRSPPLRTALEGPATLRVPARARVVAGPDGLGARVEGGAFFEATRPGNYLFLEDDIPITAFSLNAPAGESDLRRGALADLQRALPAATWVEIRGAGGAEWAREIYPARRGRLAWRPLVVVLVLASIVEASLAAAGWRQRPTAGDVRTTRTSQSQAKSP